MCVERVGSGIYKNVSGIGRAGTAKIPLGGQVELQLKENRIASSAFSIGFLKKHFKIRICDVHAVLGT